MTALEQQLTKALRSECGLADPDLKRPIKGRRPLALGRVLLGSMCSKGYSTVQSSGYILDEFLGNYRTRPDRLSQLLLFGVLGLRSEREFSGVGQTAAASPSWSIDYAPKKVLPGTGYS